MPTATILISDWCAAADHPAPPFGQQPLQWRTSDLVPLLLHMWTPLPAQPKAAPSFSLSRTALNGHKHFLSLCSIAGIAAPHLQLRSGGPTRRTVPLRYRWRPAPPTRHRKLGYTRGCVGHQRSLVRSSARRCPGATASRPCCGRQHCCSQPGQSAKQRWFASLTGRPSPQSSESCRSIARSVRTVAAPSHR